MSGLLQEYLTRHAERNGEAVAVVMEDQRLTYAALESLSNRLARLLVQAGCARGDRVCLFTPKSPLSLAGMLATLKAGCAYVPIDVGGPGARAARIVRRSDPAAVLTLGSGAKLVGELRGSGALAPTLPVCALDSDVTDDCPAGRLYGTRDIAAQDEAACSNAASPDDPAHILFTSGSTGEPKGVVITHRNVDAFVSWAISYFGTRPGDRVSGHPPLHFDLSTFDIYASLRAGAELHLVPPGAMLPHQLSDFILASELTQWFCVPSTMTYMSKLGAVPDEGFPSLDRVMWCGEVLPTPVLADWMRRVPQASFTNLYGPTETTIASSYHTVRELPGDESLAIPIGVACDGEELLVLNDHRELVADGETGELCIGGSGVSPGYWRDEPMTRSAFVPDPRPTRDSEIIYRTGDLARRDNHGLLHFLGRSDSQIKSRGYRIELGEIEAAINAVNGVTECAVVAVDSTGFEGTSICCAFASVRGAALSPVELRMCLSSTLPAYMLPSRWRSMGALPKNLNGKIDRRRVTALFRSQVAEAGRR